MSITGERSEKRETDSRAGQGLVRQTGGPPSGGSIADMQGRPGKAGYMVESLKCQAKECAIYSGGFGAAEHLTKAML